MGGINDTVMKETVHIARALYDAQSHACGVPSTKSYVSHTDCEYRGALGSVTCEECKDRFTLNLLAKLP
jgi:hypothetical protein